MKPLTTVYRHFDAHGRLLYVGKTMHFRKRSLEHKRDSSWFREVRTIQVEHFDSARDAVLAEIDAVEREKPLYNVLLQKPELGPSGIFAPLSPRENQVLGLLRDGKAISETSRELGLSVKTVSTYKSRIAEKMNLHSLSNAEIVARAISLGLVGAA